MYLTKLFFNSTTRALGGDGTCLVAVQWFASAAIARIAAVAIGDYQMK